MLWLGQPIRPAALGRIGDHQEAVLNPLLGQGASAARRELQKLGDPGRGDFSPLVEQRQHLALAGGQGLRPVRV